jgi:hypothetical protein
LLSRIVGTNQFRDAAKLPELWRAIDFNEVRNSQQLRAEDAAALLWANRAHLVSVDLGRVSLEPAVVKVPLYGGKPRSSCSHHTNT